MKLLSRGFTLIEIIVAIAVIAVLSGIVLFSVTQYINVTKDSNVGGALSTLVVAGEIFYGGNGNSYYDDLGDTDPLNDVSFCDPQHNSVLKNIINQMPPAQRPVDSGDYGIYCYTDDDRQAYWTGESNVAGLCCYVNEATETEWVAFVRNFVDPDDMFCVDSRGIKKPAIDGSEANRATIRTAYKCL